MKEKRILSIIIITIVLILLTINIIMNNNIIIGKEKKVVKGMSETTQVTELNNQINDLNTSYNEYMNYIKTSKAKVANAITDMGVATLETAEADTMATNIKSIINNANASVIKYNNASSGLTSTNIQGAIDEIDVNVDELNTNLYNKRAYFEHILGTGKASIVIETAAPCIVLASHSGGSSYNLWFYDTDERVPFKLIASSDSVFTIEQTSKTTFQVNSTTYYWRIMVLSIADFQYSYISR